MNIRLGDMIESRQIDSRIIRHLLVLSVRNKYDNAAVVNVLVIVKFDFSIVEYHYNNYYIFYDSDFYDYKVLYNVFDLQEAKQHGKR